jgi:hypothetical protein
VTAVVRPDAGGREDRTIARVPTHGIDSMMTQITSHDDHNMYETLNGWEVEQEHDAWSARLTACYDRLSCTWHRSEREHTKHISKNQEATLQERSEVRE